MDEIVLCYSGKSKVTAQKIAEASNGRIRAVRRREGDVNWGRNDAITELNEDTSNTTNKREMRLLFKENDVPMPRLVDPMFVKNCQFPLVGRPDHHMRGRGYWKCEDLYEIHKAQRGTRRKKAATHFMEFIPNAQEYRVHIFNGKSIRISEKDHTRLAITDVHYDARTARVKAEIGFMAIKPTCDKETLKSIRRAAKRAVKAVGLDFGAVDVLVNDNGVYVLEVNSAPGLGGSLPNLYAENIINWFDNREEN